MKHFIHVILAISAACIVQAQVPLDQGAHSSPVESSAQLGQPDTREAESIRLTDDAAESTVPRLAIDANYIYVVWQDNRDGNNEIYWKKLDHSGATVVADSRVTNTTGSSVRPDIGTDGAGQSCITWQEESSIKFIVLDANGAPTISTVSVSGGSCESPNVSHKRSVSFHQHILLRCRTVERSCRGQDLEGPALGVNGSII